MYEQACEIWQLNRKIIELQPHSPDAEGNLANAFEDKSRVAEAKIIIIQLSSCVPPL